ncbi:hypothetical protein QZH46_04815 [Pseudomonas corrugata]
MKNDSAGGTIKHSHVGKVCKGKQGQSDGPVLADDSWENLSLAKTLVCIGILPVRMLLDFLSENIGLQRSLDRWRLPASVFRRTDGAFFLAKRSELKFQICRTPPIFEFFSFFVYVRVDFSH